jgi:hypothetical protein
MQTHELKASNSIVFSGLGVKPKSGNPAPNRPGHRCKEPPPLGNLHLDGPGICPGRAAASSVVGQIGSHTHKPESPPLQLSLICDAPTSILQ